MFSAFYFIFSIGLISGSINSIVLKLLYQSDSITDNGVLEHFHKPWFMSLVMFVAMTIALPIYIFKYRKTCSSREFLRLLVPSVFDLTGSSLQQVGLVFTPVSTYQMLKGSILMFSALLSVTFLGKKMRFHNWVGLSICLVALFLVGVSSMLADNGDAKEQSYLLFGIVIIILSQIICAAQYVVEEYLLHPPNDVHPLVMVGVEGIWGTLLMTGVALPILQTSRGSDSGNVLENSYDTVELIGNSSYILVLTVLFFVSVLIFNMCGVMVTSMSSAIHHTFLDATRTLLIWLGSVCIYYISGGAFGEALTQYSWIQAIGFALLVVGQMIYDNIVSIGDQKPLPKNQVLSYVSINDMRSPLLK